MRKAFISIFMGLLVTAGVFAQSQDYRNLLNKAKGYEDSGNWIYAMCTYYDAYSKYYPNSTTSDAYKGYKAIADAIRKGNPGNRTFTKSEMQGNWKALMAEYEKYWCENSANYLSFEKLKKETSSSGNTFSLNMSFYRTEKYSTIKGVVENGYNKARQDSWSTSSSWPLYSIYQDNVSSGFKNGCYLMRYDGKNFSAGVVKTGEYVFYEVTFDVEDLNGNVLVEEQSAVLSSGQRFVVTAKSSDAAKKIQSGKCKIVVKKVNLLYGNINTTNGASWAKSSDVKRKSMKLEGITVSTPYDSSDSSKYDDYDDDYDDDKDSSSSSRDECDDGNYAEDDDFYTATSGSSSSSSSSSSGKINLTLDMASVLNKDCLISRTEITQKLYEEVMGDNPSLNVGTQNPVENVSWFDAIVFCNRLSELDGLTPVYVVRNSTDPSDWGYEPHQDGVIPTVKWNSKADGYRLPTEEEWEAAANSGKAYVYSGSNTCGNVCWSSDNSGGKTHKVAQKAANAGGFYDMSGNVWEWCWNSKDELRYARGGCYSIKSTLCKISSRQSFECGDRNGRLGFRVACGKNAVNSSSTNKTEEDSFVGSDKYDSSRDDDVVYTDKGVIKTPTGLTLVHLPGKGLLMGQTEVTQALYKKVMGENPSKNVGTKNPVENVSFFDAIVFCNKLSELEGLKPVYSVNGSTNTGKWRYVPHQGDTVPGNITVNESADGYRLPTSTEWADAATAGKSYSYAGSSVVEKVAWYSGNAGKKTHEVATKGENSYGLYDMCGNVWEWTWSTPRGSVYNRTVMGGSFASSASKCRVTSTEACEMASTNADLGFRVVRYSMEDTVRK